MPRRPPDFFLMFTRNIGFANPRKAGFPYPRITRRDRQRLIQYTIYNQDDTFIFLWGILKNRSV